jgi:tetratricopeptide (TPR) repeat protein
MAWVHRDFDAAERLYAESRPKFAASRSVTENAISDMGIIRASQGRIRESLLLRDSVASRQFERGRRDAILDLGLDSARLIALARENAPQAREVLHRALKRMPPDSLPLLDRPYEDLVAVAAFSGDAALTRQTRADLQRFLVAKGKMIDRAALEAWGDGLVEFADGRFEQALTKFNAADQLLLPCTECTAAGRFLAFNRLGRSDSALAAGEAFLKLTRAPGIDNDALFRPGILQRLGELYEAKGMPDKALAHYQEFVTLWKNADPDLQPRVRDVRGRIERIQAKKG